MTENYRFHKVHQYDSVPMRSVAFIVTVKSYHHTNIDHILGERSFNMKKDNYMQIVFNRHNKKTITDYKKTLKNIISQF